MSLTHFKRVRSEALRELEKELPVSKLVRRYRKRHPKADRAIIHENLRLQYQKKSLEKLKAIDSRHEAAFLKLKREAFLLR